MTDPGPIDPISHHISLALGDMRTAALTERAGVAAESRSAALANAAIAQALALSRIERHLSLIAQKVAGGSVPIPPGAKQTLAPYDMQHIGEV